MYYAFVSTSDRPIFLCDSIKVVKYHEFLGEVEVDGAYWIGYHNSTSHFEYGNFDREIETLSGRSYFYSFDKDECMKWLQEKYDLALSFAKIAYEGLCNTKIEDYTANLTEELENEQNDR